MWVSAALLILVTVYPLIRLIWSSFEGPIVGMSLGAYREITHHPLWVHAWRNTFTVALASTALAVFPGTAGAVLTERTDLPGRKFWRLMFLLPMFVPSYVLSVAWLQWAGAKGQMVTIEHVRYLGQTTVYTVHRQGRPFIVADLGEPRYRPGDQARLSIHDGWIMPDDDQTGREEDRCSPLG